MYDISSIKDKIHTHEITEIDIKDADNIELYALVFVGENCPHIWLVGTDDYSDVEELLDQLTNIKAVVVIGDINIEINLQDAHKMYEECGWLSWLDVAIWSRLETIHDEKYRITIAVTHDDLYDKSVREHIERLEEELRALLKTYNLKAKIFDEATGNEMTVK